MLPQKKTNSSCCTTALAIHLLLFSASYYLHSSITASEACYMLQEEHVYWYGHVAPCGSDLLRHGLNFSILWFTVRLISVEKDQMHVLMQNVVTLNTCRDIACLTLQLPHITTCSFQSHRRQQKGIFRASSVWKNATNLQSDEKVLQFTS